MNDVKLTVTIAHDGDAFVWKLIRDYGPGPADTLAGQVEESGGFCASLEDARRCAEAAKAKYLSRME